MTLPEFIPFGGQEVPVATLDESRIAVLPLPYEAGASYGEGSQYGPYHLLDASAQIEAVDEESGQNWTKIPIYTLPPLDIPDTPEAAMDVIRKEAGRILDKGKRLLSLGGDHAITIATAGASAEKYPGVGILQIDAHLDLRDTWNGSRFNHACVMRRLVEDHGIPTVAVGIRSFSREEMEFAHQAGHSIFFSHDITPLDNAWMDRAISLLPPRVYISLDLDGLDPSMVPGTGTPEPGGLTYRQVVRLLQKTGKMRQVVAADITELSVIPGSHVSEYTAARLAQKICLYCLAK